MTEVRGFWQRLAVWASRVRGDLPLLLLDSLLVGAVYVSILVVRFDGRVPANQWATFPRFLALALAVHLSFNGVWRLYGQMWRYASIAEARRLVLAGLSAMVVLLAAALAWDHHPPLSVVVLGGAMDMMLSGAVRFQSRLFAFNRAVDRRLGARVAVVGAGEAGAAIVREMQRDPASGLHPVAIVDDDPRTRGRMLAGVPVLGAIDDLAGVIARLGVQQVVVAITNAEPSLVRRVARQSDTAGVAVKVLPPVRERLGGQASVRDVRDLQIEDLLGRQQVATDLDRVREALGGRRVLITGAGGSIGSEIARQVAACDPRELILLDHDETHLHDAASLLSGPVHQALVDIRDASEVTAVFSRFRPEVVFHAAAHKHVPLLEGHPSAAVKTNVVGTANVVDASRRFQVSRFVFISTDKAVQPSSVMGATKSLGEHIVLENAPAGGHYCAVRFGNVLGSRGSVIPTFARQIASGGPVTVTDARMTRFFMSVQEAVQLVLQAAAFSSGGEVFMLEMGEPVSIVGLAERMIRLSGRNVGSDVAIRIVGKRPGEKLAEELRRPGEDAHPTEHPSIVRLYPRRFAEGLLSMAVEQLNLLARARKDDEVARLLFALANDPEGATGALLAVSRPHVDLDLVELERSRPWSPSSS